MPKPWPTAVKRSEKLLIKLWTFEYIYIYIRICDLFSPSLYCDQQSHTLSSYCLSSDKVEESGQNGALSACWMLRMNSICKWNRGNCLVRKGHAMIHTSCKMVILQSEDIQHLSRTNMCLLFLNVQWSQVSSCGILNLLLKRKESHISQVHCLTCDCR
jgi:hypothetical protein